MGMSIGGSTVAVVQHKYGAMHCEAFKGKLEAVLQMIDRGDLGGGNGYGCDEHKAALHIIERQIAETRRGIAEQEANDAAAGVRVDAPPSETQVRAAFEKRMLDFGWRNFDGSVCGDPKCWYYDNSDLNARWVGWREAMRAAGVPLGVALPATASEAHRLADEFYNGTAEKDWPAWAQETVVILERAAASGVAVPATGEKP